MFTPSVRNNSYLLSDKDSLIDHHDNINSDQIIHKLKKDSNDFDENYYNSNISMPLVVGLFVAMILGWMLFRYKMSANERSRNDGSIYCCPDNCFNFCAKIFVCHFGGFKIFMKKPKPKTPKIIISRLEETNNFTMNNMPESSVNSPSISKNSNSNQISLSDNQRNEKNLDHNHEEFPKKLPLPQIKTLLIESDLNGSNLNSENNNNSDNLLLKPSDSLNNSTFFGSFLKRDSVSSSRRGSALPGLMRTNAMVNSSSFFLSFQSKNLTSFT